jgi:hypothetical protein
VLTVSGGESCARSDLDKNKNKTVEKRTTGNLLFIFKIKTNLLKAIYPQQNIFIELNFPFNKPGIIKLFL